MASHGHAHAHGAHGASDRRLLGTIVLNLSLTVAQVVGGSLSGSLALVADALHNLNDALALVIVYVARRIGRRRADRRRTFGYRRAQVVGATVNLVALGVVALFLAYEAVLRLFEPRQVDGWTVVILGGIALAVDVATVLLLVGMRKGDMNARAAFVHNLGDALASVAVVLGGVLILTADRVWVDPVLSLLIVGYIARQVIGMLPGALRILMESAPPGLELEAVRAAITEVDGVRDAHHLHAWLLDEDRCALEAHVVVAEDDLTRMETIKREIREVLTDRFSIHHATLEVETPATAAARDHDTGLVPEEARQGKGRG